MRDKLQRNVQPFLEPGEQLQTAFPAQSGLSPYYFFLTWLTAFAEKYAIVAVTDRRILVLRSSMWRPASPQSVLQTLPRETPLGPVKGAVWGKLQLGDTRYWVHRRYYGDVRAAESAS